MNTTRKYSGKATSMQTGLFWGLIAGLSVTAIFAAGLSQAINLQRMEWENVGYGIMVLILVSSFLGALLAYHKIKRRRLVVCLSSGAIYYAALLSITALFFGGQFEAIGVTGGLVLAGSGSAGLLEFRHKKIDRGRGIRKAYC